GGARRVSRMTCRRLEWLVRARGTEVAAWPEPDRSAALALLRQDGAAQQAFADAVASEEAPDADLAALCRMQSGFRLAMAPAPAVVRGIGWSALVVCLAAGLYLGTGAVDNDIGQDLFSDAQTVTFAALDQ